MGGDTNQNNMSSAWTPPAAAPAGQPNSIIDINKYLGPPGGPVQASGNKGATGPAAGVTGQTFPQQPPQQPPPAQLAGNNKGPGGPGGGSGFTNLT